jgi:hypothetical protein
MALFSGVTDEELRLTGADALRIQAAEMRAAASRAAPGTLQGEMNALAGRYDRLARYADECETAPSSLRRDARLKVIGGDTRGRRSASRRRSLLAGAASRFHAWTAPLRQAMRQEVARH